jgi:hypothetical protein
MLIMDGFQDLLCDWIFFSFGKFDSNPIIFVKTLALPSSRSTWYWCHPIMIIDDIGWLWCQSQKSRVSWVITSLSICNFDNHFGLVSPRKYPEMPCPRRDKWISNPKISASGISGAVLIQSEIRIKMYWINMAWISNLVTPNFFRKLSNFLFWQRKFLPTVEDTHNQPDTGYGLTCWADWAEWAGYWLGSRMGAKFGDKISHYAKVAERDSFRTSYLEG